MLLGYVIKAILGESVSRGVADVGNRKEDRKLGQAELGGLLS